MSRALLAATAALTLGLLAAGTAEGYTTRLSAFANKADRPQGYLLAGDRIHVIARRFIPKALCKPKVKFTLTDRSGKKFRVGSESPGFGTFGEGAMNRGLEKVPAGAKPGRATLRSKQKCRLGQASGKDTVRIIDPNQPRPKVTQTAALDVLSGRTTTLALSVDRYAYVNVVVEWELVPGEWRLIDVVANQEFLPAADTYSLDWRARAGGDVPPGHYRFRITPRAPGVGNGQPVTQDFFVAKEFGRRQAPGRAPVFRDPFGVDVNGNARILVADAIGRVRELDFEGDVVDDHTFGGGVFSPVDASGERGLPLFVADAGGRRIARRASAGDTQFFGSAGTGPGQFSPAKGPQAVAATAQDGGRVYVVDGDLPRVQAFDLAGNLQGTITGGALSTPQGVATAPDGTVWVADNTARLLHFSAAGTPLNDIPTGSPFATTPAVDVDPGGRVVALDGRSLALVPPGSNTIVRRFGRRLLGTFPRGVATAGLAGDLYVTTGSRVLWFRVP